jgi:hypothetical protein
VTAETWRCSACDTNNSLPDNRCMVCDTHRFEAPRRHTPGRQKQSNQVRPATFPTSLPRTPVPPPRPSVRRRTARSVGRSSVVLTIAGAILGLTILSATSYAIISNAASKSAHDRQVTATGAVPTDTPTTATTVTTQAAPSTVGIVDISAVNYQPQATPVGQMFDTYFTGINQKNYAQALRMYDPAGVVDPADPDQVNTFSQAISTSTDSGVALTELHQDTTGQGAVEARVVFTSHQSAGYGPDPFPEQSCTHWDITYVLSDDQSVGYRILGNSQHNNSAC